MSNFKESKTLQIFLTLGPSSKIPPFVFNFCTCRLEAALQLMFKFLPVSNTLSFNLYMLAISETVKPYKYKNGIDRNDKLRIELFNFSDFKNKLSLILSFDKYDSQVVSVKNIKNNINMAVT